MPRPSTNFLLGKVPCFAMLIILLAVLNTKAQHYTLSAFSETFTPITGTGVSIQSDDVISGNIPIGFSFNYFGSDYTELKASSNGFVTFDLFEGDNSFNEIGSSFFTHNLLAPLWDDLDGSSGQASYITMGSEIGRASCREGVWV